MKPQPHTNRIIAPARGAVLRCCLFGGLRLSWGDRELPQISSRPARSLFAYLITYRQRPHTRDLLAGTFWPDVPDAQARRRLSQALWQIKQVFSTLPTATPFILATLDAVQFNEAAPYWLDVAEFQNHCAEARGDRPHRELKALRRAASLYKGDFMAGFYDDWIVIERERLREVALATFIRLVELCKAQGAFEDALRYGRQLVREDPLREEGHREVMRLCHLLGRGNEALRQYDLCQAVLAQELGAEPTATTTALYDEIAARIGETEKPFLPLDPSSPPAPLLEGAGQVEMVGREGERAILVGYLQQVIGGRGGLVLAEGGSGVGKTRLLQEIARDAQWRGVRVLWGHGREFAEQPPYGPLSEAMRAGISPLQVEQLAQRLDRFWLREVNLILPEVGQWLPDLTPRIAREQELEHSHLLEALTRTLLALGQITPHLLILEDLQWFDNASLTALTTLARRLAESHLLVIASYRSGAARERPAVWKRLQEMDQVCWRRLQLSSLTAVETGDLVRQSLGLRGKVPRFEERLYRETEGNPLFVLETLRTLYDEGLLYRDESGEWSTPWDGATVDYAELPLPAGVIQVISRRLARVGPDERAILNTAAVLGSGFDLALLLQSTDLERVKALTAVSELERRRLLENVVGDYRFSHDKVRQVVYTEMATAERRRLHRRAGEAMETLHPQQVESLAYHFTAAQVRDKTALYNRQAGDRARAVYANQAALTHYDQALLAVDKDDLVTRWEVHRQREEVLDILGRREEQAASLAEMMQLAQALGDESRRGVTLFRQGKLQVRTGAPREGLALLQESAGIARKQGNHGLAGQCLIMMGRAHWLLGDAPRCLAAAEKAQELFQQAGDHEGEIGALNIMGNLYLGLLGRYEQALRSFEQILAISQELGDVEWENVARENAGLTLTALGCYQQSQDYLSRAEPFLTKVGDNLRLAAMVCGRSRSYLGMGDYEAARSVAEQSLALCREIGNRNFEIENLMVLGRLALYQGQFNRARRHFEASTRIAQASDQVVDIGIHQSCLALAHLHLDEGEKARRLSTESVSILQSAEPGTIHMEAVFFHHYQILAQLEGAEAAQPYLVRAHEVLMDRAGDIRDPELRRSFLENVRENQEIIAAFETWRAGARPARVRLPRVGVPTGRPLRDDEWVEVTWTVSVSKDEAISGKVARRRHRLLRLLQEAREQGAAPTVDDLAAALEVSRATIKRDLADFRKIGHDVRTRGSRSR